MGLARLAGNLGLDCELGMASERVIVTAERVVERLKGPLELPGAGVDVVVQAPRGAWPTSCYPEYPVDGRELLTYVDSCSVGKFNNYLERFMGRYPGWTKGAEQW